MLDITKQEELIQSLDRIAFKGEGVKTTGLSASYIASAAATCETS